MPTKKSTKKAPTKKAAPSKPATKTRVVKQRAAASAKSFAIVKEEKPFLTFRVTKETLYWVILGAVIIMFTVWIMKLQSDIQEIYDQIDTASSETLLLDETPKKK